MTGTGREQAKVSRVGGGPESKDLSNILIYKSD
jgi:hypothetical protein